MVENYRAGMLGQLTRKCQYNVDGLLRAGFIGGWLWQSLCLVCVFPHGAFLVEGV